MLQAILSRQSVCSSQVFCKLLRNSMRRDCVTAVVGASAMCVTETHKLRTRPYNRSYVKWIVDAIPDAWERKFVHFAMDASSAMWLKKSPCVVRKSNA